MNVLEARRVLGVRVTATSDEVARAYRKQVYRVHPDRNSADPHAAERVIRLNEAYDTVRRAEAAPRRTPSGAPSPAGPAWDWFNAATDAAAAGDPSYVRGTDPLTDLINDIRKAVHDIDPRAAHVAVGMAIGAMFLTAMMAPPPLRTVQPPVRAAKK